MPFIFIFGGIVFVTVGVRGTAQQLITQVRKDFSGNDNFVYWVISIGVIGGLGYIEDFRTFSRALLTLILIVLLIAEDNKQGGGGLFEKFQSSIKTITGG